MAESPHVRQLPLSIRLSQKLMVIGGRWFPGLAASIAYRIWFMTRQYPVPLREQQWLETAHERIIDCDGLPVTVYEWGEAEAPLVFLVHGWSGRGLQLGGIAMALADAGFRAVSIDLPAHGKTPGKQTNAFAMAKTIQCVAQHYQAVDDQLVEEKALPAIVTHSFGVVPTLYLMRKSLKVQRMVCICPPDTMEFLFSIFIQYMKIPPTVEQRVKAKLEKDFDRSIWQEISPLVNVRRLSEEDTSHAPDAVLVVHDKDDRDVAIEHGEALVSAWPGAALHRTAGLGHTRILRDQETVAAIVRYITT